MCNGSFQGQKTKICLMVVPLLVEEERSNVEEEDKTDSCTWK